MCEVIDLNYWMTSIIAGRLGTGRLGTGRLGTLTCWDCEHSAQDFSSPSSVLHAFPSLMAFYEIPRGASLNLAQL